VKRLRFTEDILRNVGIGSHMYAKDGDSGLPSVDTCADNDASVREGRRIERDGSPQISRLQRRHMEERRELMRAV
jgi:hypothetical protein